jgi:hypothetical protein
VVHTPKTEVAKVQEPAPIELEDKKPEVPKLSCDEMRALACQFLSDPAIQLVLPELAKTVIAKIVQEARAKEDPAQAAARVLEVVTSHSAIQNHPVLAVVRPHLEQVQGAVARLIGSIPTPFIEVLDQLKDGFQFNANLLMSMLSNPMEMFSSGVDCGKFDLESLGISMASLAPALASLGNFSCGPFDFGFECKAPCQPSQDSSSVAHGNVRCDGCNVFPIVGPRYNCTVCPDFDLCATCEASSVHPAEHPLLKFRQPVNAQVVHHGITCDGCQQSPITGIRFKCRTCDDFDLCETCEAKNIHPADHPLVKFKVEKARQGRRGHGQHPLHKLFRQAFRQGPLDGLFSRGPHHGWSHRSRWLSRGAVGEAVKEIQQALKIQVDGFFGAKTEEAVKEFQAAQSLDADGIVGPRTRAKLIPTKPEEDKIPSRQPMGSWWLARGAVGESVKEIQRALGVPVDGFFGPRTEQAVKEFQGAHSLDADGVVGPRTRAELARVQTAVPEKKDAQTAPQPPVPESPAMAQLVSMGFPDVNLNAELLKKHNGDVEQVIAVLIGA